MADELPIEEQIDEIADTTFLIFDKLGDYGAKIAGSLYLVIGAMLVIFLIHRLAGKLIYPSEGINRPVYMYQEGDRVVVVQEDFSRVELPEKADVLVTETYGAWAFGEGMMDGFWSAAPYFGFLNTFRYEAEHVVLDRYTIVEAVRTRTIFNWFQYFDRDELTAEFPMLALIFTRKRLPMTIGSDSGWLMLDGMIARPRATSARTNSGGTPSRRAMNSISGVISPRLA